MILLGYTWKDNPPKDRQGISGYRTTMSRLNDETWKYAHKYWGGINFVLGTILAILFASYITNWILLFSLLGALVPLSLCSIFLTVGEIKQIEK